MKPVLVLKTLLVVGVLGTTGAVVWPNTMCILDDSPTAQAKSEIRNIESALMFYRLDNLKFPSTDQGLKALVERPVDPSLKLWPEHGYLPRIPIDPWGHQYQYAHPGRYGEIDIFTLGRDGRVGGEELDATIGNWNLDN